MEKIYLIPIGHIDEKLFGHLTDYLEKKFPYTCVVGPRSDIPPVAYNVERSQFLASAILEEMKLHLPQDAARILGVTDVDLYVPDLNFVFGLADVPGPAALISVCRLWQEFYGLERDEKLFRSRMIKEAVHEGVLNAAMVYLLLIGAMVFSPFIALSRVPTLLAEGLSTLPLAPVAIMGVIVLAYFLLGFILDSASLMVITVPILLPVFTTHGFDMVWVGE